MCGSCTSEAIWGRNEMPPHKVSSLMLGMKRASRRSSLLTWSASSRVGHSTRHCTRLTDGSSRDSKPKPKDAVLPLPVLACAMTSLPCNTQGRLAAWIGVISS